MAQASRPIKCMILTLQSENVIVPKTAIAEILSVKDAMDIANMPEWYVGKMLWRGVNVPLVSFEAAGGDNVKKVNLNTQVAMLYSIKKDTEYPYLGVVISGVPHEADVAEGQITLDEHAMKSNTNPMAAMKARINGAAVSVLNLGAIEAMVIKAEGF
jgi:chemosensory pili system protein ChpC